ncbi:CidA/LrgA family holin-like protein [Bacillaceae bacterium IKA-2]|nr:CidA/LrgA family holin-like protein [Bacillaceae bacterium IKA-2]
MKFIQIFVQIALLYGLFLTGKWLQDTFQLFIPGSIIGMMIFFVLLLTGLFQTKWFEKGSELLLSHMPLLFLPVTAGLLNYYSFFQGKGALLIVVVLISTMIVLVSSAYVGQIMVQRKERQQ